MSKISHSCLREQARLASATLISPDGRNRSGWFFTSKGHFLTAGHKLQGSRELPSGKYFIQSPFETAEVELLDFQPGGGTNLDYAIFAKIGRTDREYHFLPVSRAIPGGEIEFPGECFIAGTTHSLSKWGAFTVRLESFTSAVESSAALQFLCRGENLPAEGLSGGALCLENRHDRNGAIGIQIQQPVENNTVFAAQPLGDVYSHSAVFRDLLDEQRLSEQRSSWDLHKLEEDFLIRGAPSIGERKRIALFIRNYTNSSVEIFTEFQQSHHGIVSRFSRLIAGLMWLDPKIRDKPLKWEFYGYGATEPIQNNLERWIAPGGHLRDENAGFMRVIVDLAGCVDFLSKGAIRRHSNGSHLIGIQSVVSEVEGKKNSIIDLFLKLPPEGKHVAVERLKVILEDILLDACIFNGLPIVRRLFGSIEGRRVFSHAKIQFIQSSPPETDILTGVTIGPTAELSLGGLDSYLESASYFPLSALARPTPLAPHDLVQLETIWRRFVTEFLLPAVRDREGGLAPLMTDEEVIKAIRRRRLFGGQISLKRLRKAFAEVSPHFGELHAVVMLRKMPSKTKLRPKFRTLFGRAGSAKLFCGDDLANVTTLFPFVEFHLFRRA